MTLPRVATCLILTAAVLAACSKPPAGAASPGAAGGVQAGGSSAVSNSELPQQKIGQWETRISYTADSGPARGGVTTHCLDAAAQASGKQTADAYAKANCSRNETHREGDKWVSDLVCKAGAGAMTTHSVTAFAGEDAYHTEMTVTYDPPIAGRSATVTTIDGKWLGPCKPT